MKTKFLLLQLLSVIFLCSSYAQDSILVMDDMKQFEQTSGNKQIASANSFLSKLYKQEFIDKLERYDAKTPFDTICKHVYFRATEYVFYELADYEQTLYYGNKALKVMQRCKEVVLEGECESILAIACFRRSDFVAALKHAHNDLAIQRKLNDASSISSALNTIAGIYLATHSEKEAYDYIQEAIKFSTQAKDTSRVAIQKGMASEILLNLNRYEEAFSFAREAYQLDSLMGNRPKMGIRLSQQASPLIKLERYDEAKDILTQAIPILKEYKIGVSLAICHNQLGYIANLQEKYDEAVPAFTQSLAFFMRQHDLYNEAKAREGLYKALRETQPAEALKHMERLSVLKDSLYTKEMKEALSQAHAQYTNEQLLSDREHHQTVRTLFLVTVIALTVVTMFIAICLIYFVRRRTKENQEDKLIAKEVVMMDADDMLTKEEEEFVKELNQFIDSHMSEIFEVDALASHMSLSPKQLNRRLTAILGCNSYTYIIRRRIDYACHLLLHSTTRISDIALACGFDNPSNFARAFKDVKGCPPSIFRKGHSVK